MAQASQTSFQILCHCAELIKAREAELGAYPGDGPTSEEASTLVAALRPISEADALPTPILWAAFRSAVDGEMTWLFPERDPIGPPMTAALREIQAFAGKTLEGVMPEMGPDLEKYASLAIAANAAPRTELLHGNKIIWRLVVARVLHRIGRFLSS
jgi:hypothetical protein